MNLIWDTNFVVVDVETTGSNPDYCRIIEIALYLVRGGTIVEAYTSLVNPRQHIPKFIVQMTGITNEMVFSAPDFKKIAPEIKNFLSRENTVFVAHNVNFDYNFVKKSFERLGINFPEIPKLCTLKLARRLINGTGKKNVGSLSEHLGISLKNRHRAFGDAKATAQILLELLEIAENEHNITTTEELLKFQYKPYSSIVISEKLKNKDSIDFKDIPDSPGIYFFVDKYGNYLYIGKGKSLKNRIQSYFSSTTSKKILRLLQATKQIKWETTRTELRALIEESKAIKQYKPEFNILSKKYRNYPFIQISKHEHYPILEITYEPNPSESFCFGPFKNFETARLVFEIIHKKFKLRKCDEEVFKKHNPENCIYFQTKLCLAPCSTNFDSEVYFEEINKVKQFLTSYDDGILNFLETKMSDYANNLQFELANQIKNHIYEIKKVFINNLNKKNNANSNNYILIRNINSIYEVMFIKNGLLAWDYSFNGKFNAKSIKEKVYEIYFNGYLYSDELQAEHIDELRIILNWINQHREEITIINVDDVSAF